MLPQTEEEYENPDRATRPDQLRELASEVKQGLWLGTE
jgi:hypothetical protein